MENVLQLLICATVVTSEEREDGGGVGAAHEGFLNCRTPMASLRFINFRKKIIVRLEKWLHRGPKHSS